MLSPLERILFLVLVLICGALAFRGFQRVVAVVRRGRPADRGDRLASRFGRALLDVGLQRTLFRTRPVASFFHAFIFFGFSFYVLVNVNDLLEAYVTGWSTLGRGGVAGVFNLLSPRSASAVTSEPRSVAAAGAAAVQRNALSGKGVQRSKIAMSARAGTHVRSASAQTLVTRGSQDRAGNTTGKGAAHSKR